jgi:hypothetical protein
MLAQLPFNFAAELRDRTIDVEMNRVAALHPVRPHFVVPVHGDLASYSWAQTGRDCAFTETLRKALGGSQRQVIDMLKRERSLNQRLQVCRA